jgi:RNA polymerase sigma-70 factor, ECF subfamily
MRMLGDQARAQELAQETFVRAYQALSRGTEFQNPRAWLYRVASRLAIDHHRRAGRRQVVTLPEDLHAPTEREAEVLERLTVQSALTALHPKYRVPLLLYVYEGWTVLEIAETLQLSESAIKMRLSRAREMFRHAYERENRDVDM